MSFQDKDWITRLAMFQIEANSGIIGIWDSTISLPFESGDVRTLVTALRERAKLGDVFFIEAEDPVTYRVKVVIGADIPPDMTTAFEPRGGVFRLRVPSGKLQVDCIPLAKSERNIDVPTGEYLVHPYARRPFDSALHNQTIRELAGEADWRFQRRVTNIGAIGCLSIVIGAVLVLIPFTRPFWWASLTVFALPWFIHLGLSRLPRYKRVEALETNYEKQLAHFVLVLTASKAATEIPGGWIGGEL